VSFSICFNVSRICGKSRIISFFYSVHKKLHFSGKIISSHEISPVIDINMKEIKLSEYCKINGISYRTGWKRFKSGYFGDLAVIQGKKGMFVKVEEVTDKGLAASLQAAISDLKAVTNNLLEKFGE
jgi:hypothetical protein